MKKSNVFSNPEPIKCKCCGKDLTIDPEMSMIQIITNKNNQIVRFTPCCKGQCDHRLQGDIDREKEYDGWQDLTNFLNPYLFIKHVMGIMNSMYEEKGFESSEAFEQYKDLIIKCYPYVTRDMDKKDLEEVRRDNMMSLF